MLAAFVPIWALTAVGWLAGRSRVLGAGAVDVLGRFVFYVAMPAALLDTLTRQPISGPAGRAQTLNASQFYLRSTSSSTNLKPCIKTGCSGQICADETMMSTCEYREEYACYKKASCERQANGNCGFTKTPELTSCLARK